jgi:hypothetical protein
MWAQVLNIVRLWETIERRVNGHFVLYVRFRAIAHYDHSPLFTDELKAAHEFVVQVRHEHA